MFTSKTETQEQAAKLTVDDIPAIAKALEEEDEEEEEDNAEQSVDGKC